MVETAEFERDLLARIVQNIKPSKAAIFSGQNYQMSVSHGGVSDQNELNIELVEKVVQTEGPVSDKVHKRQLAVPYKNVDGKVLGIMYVEIAAPRRLKFRDLAILQGLGRQMVERHGQSSTGSGSSLNPETMGELTRYVRSTLSIVSSVLKPQRVLILLHLEDGPKIVASRGFDDVQDLSEVPFSRELVDHVWEKGETCHIRDALNDPQFSKFAGVKEHSLRSVCVCPLNKLDGRNRGLIYLDSCKDPAEFLTAEVSILQRLALALEKDLARVLAPGPDAGSRDVLDSPGSSTLDNDNEYSLPEASSYVDEPDNFIVGGGDDSGEAAGDALFDPEEVAELEPEPEEPPAEVEAVEDEATSERESESPADLIEDTIETVIAEQSGTDLEEGPEESVELGSGELEEAEYEAGKLDDFETELEGAESESDEGESQIQLEATESESLLLDREDPAAEEEPHPEGTIEVEDLHPADSEPEHLQEEIVEDETEVQPEAVADVGEPEPDPTHFQEPEESPREIEVEPDEFAEEKPRGQSRDEELAEPDEFEQTFEDHEEPDRDSRQEQAEPEPTIEQDRDPAPPLLDLYDGSPLSGGSEFQYEPSENDVVTLTLPPETLEPEEEDDLEPTVEELAPVQAEEEDDLQSVRSLPVDATVEVSAEMAARALAGVLPLPGQPDEHDAEPEPAEEPVFEEDAVEQNELEQEADQTGDEGEPAEQEIEEGEAPEQSSDGPEHPPEAEQQELEQDLPEAQEGETDWAAEEAQPTDPDEEMTGEEDEDVEEPEAEDVLSGEEELSEAQEPELETDPVEESEDGFRADMQEPAARGYDSEQDETAAEQEEPDLEEDPDSEESAHAEEVAEEADGDRQEPAGALLESEENHHEPAAEDIEKPSPAAPAAPPEPDPAADAEVRPPTQVTEQEESLMKYVERGLQAVTPAKHASFWQRLKWVFSPGSVPQGGDFSHIHIAGKVVLQDNDWRDDEPIEVTLKFPTHQMTVILEITKGQSDYAYHGRFEGESPVWFEVTVEKPGYFPIRLSKVTFRAGEVDSQGEPSTRVHEITLIPRQ